MEQITINDLINELVSQKERKEKGSIYHYTQVNFAFNSNKIEGSKLTEEQTEEIFDTNSYFPVNEDYVKLDDLNEMKNHFRLFDYMLENYDKPLTKEMMIEMNVILKRNTTYETDPRYNVGGFKVRENIITSSVKNYETAKPNEVEKRIERLLNDYNDKKTIKIEDIIDFHYNFEIIHPFGDGNGRVGRMIMFKECLKNNLMPFIVYDIHRPHYMRGLREYPKEKGYLNDTLLREQDEYTKAVNKYLNVYSDVEGVLSDLKNKEKILNNVDGALSPYKNNEKPVAEAFVDTNKDHKKNPDSDS